MMVDKSSSFLSKILFVFVFVLLVGGINGRSQAKSSIDPISLEIISSPTGSVLPEIDEFATTKFGDPWDMNEASDLAYYRSDSQIANSTFANGIYSGQMTNGQGGDRITLLTAGSRNNAAMRVGKIGYNYPINADYYRYLTFRMYSNNTNCNSGLIMWFADDSYLAASQGISNGFLVPPDPCINQPSGWYTYVLDLKTIGIQQGQKPWSGIIRELAMKPFAGTGAAGSTVKLDWVRLTAADPRSIRPYTIQWNNDGSGGAVSLYASPNNQTLGEDDDILIASNQSANGGSFVFQTGVLPAGTYHIAVKNNSGTVWSGSPLIINAPPQTTITRPSKTSGEEYAASVLGNAWDMNNPSDLNDVLPYAWETCVTNETFTASIYKTTILPCSTGGQYTDARLIMGHMTAPDRNIDTDKYRYLSFRTHLDGTQDVSQGWVTRFGWWQDQGGVTTELTMMSRDIIILEGWNTYRVDLWADDVVDEAISVQRTWRNSTPNRLRFDPVELHTSLLPRDFRIDWIKLTAMDEVNAGAVFPIEYTLSENQNVSLNFFYDSDTNPDNGRFPITPSTTHSAALAFNQQYKAFLPLIRGPQNGQPPLSCGTDNCIEWNTSGVAGGTYYICIESNDGFNTSYRCSEVPLIVR